MSTSKELTEISCHISLLKMHNLSLNFVKNQRWEKNKIVRRHKRKFKLKCQDSLFPPNSVFINSDFLKILDGWESEF